MLKGFIKSRTRNRSNVARESMKRWSVAEQEIETVPQETTNERYAFCSENFSSEAVEKNEIKVWPLDETADEKLQQLLELGCDHFTGQES